jgi:hypothetical protein
MRPRLVSSIAGAAIVFLLATAAVPARADAAVTDRTPGGFTVKISVPVSAPPDIVYASLVRHVAEWWDQEHTYSGDSKNLSIIAEPGGCFCEALPNGGGVQHATVIYVAPGQLVRMVGSLGPLQSAGVTGALSWAFARSGSAGATLTLTYVVGGYFPGGLDTIADAVDMVLSRQVSLLRQYAERAAGRR